MNRLPDEILLFIFAQPCLTKWDKFRFLEVCYRWRRVAGDAALWTGSYLTVKNVTQLGDALSTSLSLWLHVTRAGDFPTEATLKRVTRLKWDKQESLTRFITNDQSCPHLTHLQVRICSYMDMAVVLSHVAIRLRVLFLEEMFQETREFTEALHACMQLTHLKLNGSIREWGHFPHLIYLESNDSFHHTHFVAMLMSSLRYLYLETSFVEEYTKDWYKLACRRTLTHFHVCFDHNDRSVRGTECYRDDLKKAYPNVCVYHNGQWVYRSIQHFELGRRFTFDTIDEAV